MQLLTPKTKMPPLTLPLVGGGEFDISDISAEKFLILVAYRGVHCPKCKAQLKEIDSQFDSLTTDGYQIVAVSMDGKDRAERAKAEWDIEHLPIAYQLSLLEAKALGLFISDQHGDKEPEFFSEPGLFVIKPDGALYAEYIQNTPFSRPPIDDVIKGLNYVIENDYPTRGTSVK